MQIVIDIRDEEYNSVMYNNHVPYGVVYAIKNGTPLPKGHGRLKDVDAFLSKVKADREHSVYSRSWTADDVLNALDNSYAPTIIEADKEGWHDTKNWGC